MFLGLIASHADKRTFIALFYLPRYVVWKMSLMGKLFKSAQSNDWVRTTREMSISTRDSDTPIKNNP